MNIPTMSDQELENLYRNCINAIAKDKPTRPQAEGLIAEINSVWEKRLSAAVVGQYKAESPERGVLRRLGYQVGNDGVSLAKRRELLDFAITGQLPFTGSPAHMLEWGEALSTARYRKLHRVLTVWHSGARSKGNMEKAQANWAQDIEYIEATWRHLTK